MTQSPVRLPSVVARRTHHPSLGSGWQCLGETRAGGSKTAACGHQAQRGEQTWQLSGGCFTGLRAPFGLFYQRTFISQKVGTPLLPTAARAQQIGVKLKLHRAAKPFIAETPEGTPQVLILSGSSSSVKLIHAMAGAPISDFLWEERWCLRADFSFLTGNSGV